MARPFITITQQKGLLARDEPMLLPIDRILDIKPVPETVPVYAEGVRAIIRCKGDDVYHVTETLDELRVRIAGA